MSQIDWMNHEPVCLLRMAEVPVRLELQNFFIIYTLGAFFSVKNNVFKFIYVSTAFYIILFIYSSLYSLHQQIFNAIHRWNDIM